jgi:predicted flap endonuclease-1-like 5' DNA nuclease
VVTKRAVDAASVRALEDVPNVGPAVAADLRRIGIATPAALRGRDPYALYDALCRATRTRHDPCVLDTFIAAVRFMEGAPAKPWWAYTAERKRELATRAVASEAARRAAPRRNRSAGTTGKMVRKATPVGDLAALRNLGPASQAMLAAAGVTSVAMLRRLGAVEAFRRVRANDARASLNLLWALEGALTGRRWQDVARDDRLPLLLQLERDPAVPPARRR